MSRKVVIIGGGIGGLATANLLAAAGHEVHVYEQHSSLGGRAGQLKVDGFTFDTGPSWYLMPDVFAGYFNLLGEDIADYLDLVRLNTAYQVRFEGAPDPVTIYADIRRDAATFDAIEPGAGNQLRRYLASAAAVYQLSMKQFLYTNFQSARGSLSAAALRRGPAMLSQAFTPIHKHVSRFVNDPRLSQILEYPMVFLGASPFEAPAIYSMMSHLDFTQGVYYPRGGMYSIIEALVKLGRNRGVTYHLNAPVAAITTTTWPNAAASGIKLQDGTIIPADIVISNADLHFTETELVAPAYQTYPESYWDKRQASPSALLMYLGIKGEIPELQHHNLVFTKDWANNFDAIYKTKTWPHPASMYISKSSQTDPDCAPAGNENVFVLVPVPAQLGETPAELTAHAEQYLDQIAAECNIPNLRERIVVQKIYGPNNFAADFQAWHGTALGLSHILKQSAMFRPANQSKKLANLYYVGANTLPGIGLPMCLIGAELIYKRITGDKSVSHLTSPIAAPSAAREAS